MDRQKISPVTTPVSDFVEAYQTRNLLRLHMPGHKGQGQIEALDITEIQGAEPLYPARGILRESEENAAHLFGAARTLYSAEGSSLCIRGMLALIRMRAEAEGIPPVILAGRNAHQAFLSAAALLDLDIAWLEGTQAGPRASISGGASEKAPDRHAAKRKDPMSDSDDGMPWAGSILTCTPGPLEVAEALDGMAQPPAAVWLTSPDYLGFQADIRGIAEICHGRGIPLLIDNAHGAYLRFLPEDQHPLTLGADMTCDSAHKTLPVLTGGAWLHIRNGAPAIFVAQAERALSLFASTSPSWLILRSLDRCNAFLAGDYRDRLAAFLPLVDALKERLIKKGFVLAGDEPLKITLAPRLYGYTGDQVHDHLRAFGMECEFSDPDFLTMMITPDTGAEGLERVEQALSCLPRRAALPLPPPPLLPGEQVLTPREAMLAPAEEISLERALGRVLAAPCVSCPPAVPLLICGQRITEEALCAFARYGIRTVSCVVRGEH